MLKPAIVATAVFSIAGSSAVYAQQRFGEHDGLGGPPQRVEYRYRPSAADMAAFADARIAALKAGLKLTPDQAKNWPAFEQALRDVAQLRIARVQARQARWQQGPTPQQGQAPATPLDRLQRRADNLAKNSAALHKLADVGAPLYQSLTDAQKRRFTVLARMLRPDRHMLAFNERSGWGPGGHGFGRNGRGFGSEHHRPAPEGDDTGGQGSQL